MVKLTEFDILNGCLTIIQVIILFIVSSTILHKYFKYKDRNLLYIAIVAFFMGSPYWSPPISFLLILTTGQGLSPRLYLLIAGFGLAIAFFFWMVAFANLIYEERSKLRISIKIVYGIFCAIMEVFFVYSLLIDPTLYLRQYGPMDSHTTLPVTLFRIIGITSVLISSLYFCRQSLYSKDPEIRIKGIFHGIGITSFAIAGFIDGAFELTLMPLLIIRIITMLSAIEFYIAWVFPRWAKKILIKEQLS